MHQSANHLRSLASDKLRYSANDALIRAFGSIEEAKEVIFSSHDFFDRLDSYQKQQCGFALRCLLVLDGRGELPRVDLEEIGNDESVS